MKKKISQKELLSRREFFKKAAKGVLPILGLAVITPSILSSCTKEDDNDGGSNDSGGSSCHGCSGTCDSSCSGSCDSGCSDNCTSCTGQCWNDCNYASR
jgi:CXXX repeat radical SAM target protein